jgi:HK97 family phage major capsid protein
MATLQELEKDLREKGDELKAVFDAHRNKETGTLEIPNGDVAAEIRKRNDELTEIGKKRDEVKALTGLEEGLDASLKALRQPVTRLPFDSGGQDAHHLLPNRMAQKSLGARFVESDAYKSMSGAAKSSEPGGIRIIFDVEDAKPTDALKATFTTSAATFTEYDRQPGIVLLGQQPLTVADLVAQGETTMNTIRYPQEDTFTNAATTVSEGGTKPEATWDTSEVDAPVRKIAVTSKVTEEMWDDFPVIRDYVDSRLRFMVGQQLEAQILTGNGTPPNLTGILNVSGIQTQATGTDTNADAIYKALTKVRTVGFFEPDAVVIHPNNWTPIRLLKTTTGEYVWGAPSEMGPERIWGKQTDVTTGITANTGLVGAFKLGAQIFYRQGLRMEATNANEDDFRRNLICIRVELRAALAVYRPKAFASVTSLGT